MTLSPLAGGLLALAVVAAAAVAWRLTRTTRPVAGAGGPRRFGGARGQSSARPSARHPARGGNNRLRAAAIWGTAALLLGWVALSLASFQPTPPPQPQAAVEPPPAEPVAPPPPEVSPRIVTRLEPPPPPGTLAEAPLIGLTPPGLAPEEPPAPPAESAVMSAAVSIQEPGSGGNQNPGTFAPSEQVPAAGPPPGPPPELPPTPDGSVAASARVMFPKVSSLSPVGESVQTAIFQPRDRETLDQSRPRLVTPPRDELKPPPLSDPNLTGPKVFTVLIGSFRVPEYAERQKQMLLDAGLPAQIRPATRADNSVWHRVTSGTFERESDARSYSRDLVTRKLAGNPVIFHVPAEQQ